MWSIGCQVGDRGQKYDRQIRYPISAYMTLVTAYSKQTSSMLNNEPPAFKN